MCILRKVIYLIIFSDWTDVRIAHSTGLGIGLIKQYRKIVNRHHSELNAVVHLDDQDLYILFGSALDEFEQESAPVWQKNSYLPSTHRGYVHE